MQPVLTSKKLFLNIASIKYAFRAQLFAVMLFANIIPKITCLEDPFFKINFEY